MAKQPVWAVTVTWGTQQYAVYAAVPSLSAADKLREVARKQGYRNPKVYEWEEFERKRKRFFSDRTYGLMARRIDFLAGFFPADVIGQMRKRLDAQFGPERERRDPS
jgi:hypothetical protein